jgi:hypothetical protein
MEGGEGLNRTDFGFVLDAYFFDGNLGAVSPGAAEVGIENHFWWGSVGAHVDCVWCVWCIWLRIYEIRVLQWGKIE